MIPVQAGRNMYIPAPPHPARKSLCLCRNNSALSSATHIPWHRIGRIKMGCISMKVHGYPMAPIGPDKVTHLHHLFSSRFLWSTVGQMDTISSIPISLSSLSWRLDQVIIRIKLPFTLHGPMEKSITITDKGSPRLLYSRATSRSSSWV